MKTSLKSKAKPENHIADHITEIEQTKEPAAEGKEKRMEGFFDYIDDPVSRKLIEAMEHLMAKHPFDDISMSDILKLSGVSRSTFYRKYRDKYDLMNSCYQKLLDQTMMKIPEGMSYKKAFFAMYEALKSFPAFFKNALSSNEREGLKSYIFTVSYQVFDKLMRNQGLDMDSVYYKLLLIGYLSGSLEVTCIWAERGMKEPIGKMFRISYELMPHEIRTHLALSYM